MRTISQNLITQSEMLLKTLLKVIKLASVSTGFIAGWFPVTLKSSTSVAATDHNYSFKLYTDASVSVAVI